VILASIAKLNVLHSITTTPGAFFATQLDIIKLRQALCVFFDSTQQHGQSRVVGHTLRECAPGVNCAPGDKADCFVDEFYLSFVHFENLL
jgi:hypothetical protein